MRPFSVLLLLLSAANLQLGSSKARFAYDCENGYKHWRAAWDEPKKEWCCSYVERGCPGDSHSKEEFDCEDSINSWRLAWSDEKKGWCCENRQPWSNSHQRFCCEIKRGCHLDEHGTPFNCNKGVQAHWTKKESRWCCRNEPPKGCHLQQDTTEEPFNCFAGIARAQVGWSRRKQSWCCEHKDLGCPRQDETDDLPPRFNTWDDEDCSKDFNNRRQWPKKKICHCCKHFGIACPPVYYPPNIPDHVIVCPNLRAQRKYDVGSGPLNGTELATDYDPESDGSEAAPVRSADRSAAALAGGAALAASLGFFALAAVRMGLRRIFRGGYAAMPEKPGESFLPVEEAEAENS